jgi:hypothetical protein
VVELTTTVCVLSPDSVNVKLAPKATCGPPLTL